MSKKDKLVKRLKSRPRDFTFREAEALLLSLGCERDNKGKTSGSSLVFFNDSLKIALHRPHPRRELKMYQINEIINALEKEGLI